MKVFYDFLLDVEKNFTNCFNNHNKQTSVEYKSVHLLLDLSLHLAV